MDSSDHYALPTNSRRRGAQVCSRRIWIPGVGCTSGLSVLNLTRVGIRRTASEAAVARKEPALRVLPVKRHQVSYVRAQFADVLVPATTRG